MLLEGVPLHKPRELLGDKAYDCNAVRDGLTGLGVTATIPGKANRKEPIRFDQWRCQRRTRVEKACSARQHFRGLACRYAERADRYAGRGSLVAWFLGTQQRRRRPAAQYHQATAAA